MKQKNREAIAKFIEREVERQLAIVREQPMTYSVLSIHFDNKAVDIPYEPWKPRSNVTLPGRWITEGEPDA